jgi:LysM repeat protein
MVKQRLRSVIFVGFILLTFGVAACTRSASTPPPLPGADGSASSLTSQQATMEAVRSALLTQTAQSGDGAFPTPINTEEPESTEYQADEATQESPTEGSPEATVVVSTPQPTPTRGYEEYTVRVGDWVYSIARDFNVEPDDIISINGLKPPYKLEPGDVLKIPPPEEPPPEGATVYKVQGGDTVFGIARKFGVEPQDIIDANELKAPYSLRPGDKLIIP